MNPFDVWGQAQALHEALSLEPDERRRRAEGLKGHLRANDVSLWAAGLLADLQRAAA